MEKVASGIPENSFKNKNLIVGNGELNRFGVGQAISSSRNMSIGTVSYLIGGLRCVHLWKLSLEIREIHFEGTI